MDFTANEGSGLNSTGGSNPPVSATKSPVPAGTGLLLYPLIRARSLEDLGLEDPSLEALEVHEARIRTIK